MIKTPPLLILLFVSLLIFGSSTLFAQGLTRASMNGLVEDVEGGVGDRTVHRSGLAHQLVITGSSIYQT